MTRRSFKAIPIRPTKHWQKRDTRRRKSVWSSGFIALLIGLAVPTFVAVYLWGAGPLTSALDLGQSETATNAVDRETARFSRCSGPVRVNCVVDGDTIWYRGDKIRIADINTPEVSDPGCAQEARLGARATERLVVLLNEGPFSLEETDRDQDRYGRLLRTVTRNGESLGAVLVKEGLAESWTGRRRNWC